MLSIQMHHHWAFELPYGCRSLFALNVMDFDYFIIIVVWCIASKCNVRDVGQTVVSQPVNSTQLSFDSKIGESRECFGLFFSFFLSVFKAPDIHESTNTEWRKKNGCDVTIDGMPQWQCHEWMFSNNLFGSHSLARIDKWLWLWLMDDLFW